MTSTTKKTAILLSTAVALSSVAYALGSQAGDGGAIASGSASAGAASGGAATATSISTSARRGGGRDRGDGRLIALAARLGVAPPALREALRELRVERPSREERRARLAPALAAALNLPVSKVTDALDSALPDRAAKGNRLAGALAAELKLDVARVRAALERVRAGRPGDRRGGRHGHRGNAFPAALAAELNVDAARVRAALDRVDSGHRGDRRDGRGRLTGLASALGVDQQQLRDALERIATDERNAFADALAQKLNVDAAKVREALADLPRGLRGRHHG